MLWKKRTIHFKHRNVSPKSSGSLYRFRICSVVLPQACDKSVKIIFIFARKKKHGRFLKEELLLTEKDVIFQILWICENNKLFKFWCFESKIKNIQKQ